MLTTKMSKKARSTKKARWSQPAAAGPACPRCGGKVWDTVLDPPGVPPTADFGGRNERVVCAMCGLVGTIVGSVWFEGFSPALAQHEVHVRFERRDIRIERLGGNDGAVRVTHNASGLVAEARAYATERDNERAALQTLALKLRALEEESTTHDG
jgi:hypothetical protein